MVQYMVTGTGVTFAGSKHNILGTVWSLMEASMCFCTSAHPSMHAYMYMYTCMTIHL